MEYDEIISTPCTELNKLPEDEIMSIIDVVIDHYYENGFPYYPIDEEKIQKEYDKLLEFDVDRLDLPKNHLQQFMLGLNTVNTFHPQMWEVKCRSSKTPMEIFLDRELFTIALRKRIKYSDTKLRPYNIRKSLKAFGVQAVSNFRPTIAKWVYENFSPIGGLVLDPCAGYGGRMMGAMCSNTVREYVGVDPNRITMKNNKKLKSYLGKAALKSGIKSPIVYLFDQPFEDYIDNREYDVVFTSPPYFNVEKYDDNDINQSYIRYPTYKLWLEGFLKVLIENSYDFLRKGGYFALNTGGELTIDAVDRANYVFGSRPDTYHMRLSKMLGRGNKSEQSHKTEPINIWRKN